MERFSRIKFEEKFELYEKVFLWILRGRVCEEEGIVIVRILEKIFGMYEGIWCDWSEGSIVKENERWRGLYFVGCCGYSEDFGCRVIVVIIIKFEE